MCSSSCASSREAGGEGAAAVGAFRSQSLLEADGAVAVAGVAEEEVVAEEVEGSEDSEAEEDSAVAAVAIAGRIQRARED